VAQGSTGSRWRTKWQQGKQRSRALLKQSVQNNHNRIVTCGLVVVLVYWITWLGMIWEAIAHGESTPLLNIGFIYLGLDALWRQRLQLATLSASEEDRLVGYLLILGGAAFFPFCLSSVSLQSLLCMIILLGMALSTWGVEFFKRNLLPIALLMVSIYPDLGFLANSLRKTLTGQQLEYSMAWLGGLALSAIGQPVTVEGSILSLSTTIEAKKAVEVASGCSGFDMAFVLAGVGLIMGLFFKRSWSKIAALVATGIALALIFNVPRIMLLSFAVVYWGKESFEFWHGGIGGQIFATILLTIYYYIAMAMLRK